MTIKIKDIQTFAVLTEPETQVVIGGDSNLSQNNFGYYYLTPIRNDDVTQPPPFLDGRKPSSYSYSVSY